jgi:hypothetical protein
LKTIIVYVTDWNFLWTHYDSSYSLSFMKIWNLKLWLTEQTSINKRFSRRYYYLILYKNSLFWQSSDKKIRKVFLSLITEDSDSLLTLDWYKNSLRLDLKLSETLILSRNLLILTNMNKNVYRSCLSTVANFAYIYAKRVYNVMKTIKYHLLATIRYFANGRKKREQIDSMTFEETHCFHSIIIFSFSLPRFIVDI